VNKKNIVCFIFARKGSKGIPNKNIQILDNIPLIAHSIKAGLDSPSIDHVIVSTDSQKIADIALKFGAEVPFIRPKELAQDNSNELDAWKHGIKLYEQYYKKNIDVFISLPPTAPFRSTEDIENCIKEFNNQDCDIVITVKEAKNNPYFNMVKNNSLGFSEIVIPGSERSFFRRQDAPKVFDMTTVAYVADTRYILNSNGILQGKVKSVVIPDDRALDIDNIIDFQFAKFLKEKNKK
jgi:N,N'-diacetyl-8-epilegionaminate cytidylyltransferase